mgnify:CR=1 FL=1
MTSGGPVMDVEDVAELIRLRGDDTKPLEDLDSQVRMSDGMGGLGC